ncbi:MAG: hypothetical protein L0I76_02490 [Pseudonocardia sp.]|nr:hypothetical protein [Pseudonocardia sp.]
MRLPDGETPVAGSGVQVALLGTVEAPEGGRVVTYSGWPLYTYVDDAVPGQATGQALDLNGAPWYVLRPSGELVVPAGSSSMGGTS